jgi:ribosomal protein L11 methyltransferase
VSWLEISAEFKSPPEDWSAVVEAFRRYGLDNTLQTDVPPTMTSCIVQVPGSDVQIENLARDLNALGATKVGVKPYLEQNWEEAWKKFFKPRRVGSHFVVRPTWEEFAPQAGDLVITLDPGQAFGTGDHPTTRMCLQLLESVDVKSKHVLDIGCGSGVLAIGAKLLGASQVLAIDVDPLAVEVSRQNARLNGQHIECLVDDGIPDQLLDSGAPCWNVILSNIISAAVMGIAPDVARIIQAGGSWVVSGILETNWSEVLRVAQGLEFRLARKMQEDDWVAAIFLR